jgi:hypothetical protein
MPKDPKKNVDRYKIRGGELNEFDFHQNQQDYAKEKSLTGKNLIPVKVAKATKSTKERKTPIGASAKKLAARKAAKKK